VNRRALRRGNWSVQELERLRELLPRRGVQAMAILLRRSAECVYRKAMEIMRQPPRKGAWRQPDDELLRCAWGVLDRRLLGAILGRAPGEVVDRAQVLRAAPRGGIWTAAERRRLKVLYGTRSDEDLEVALQRGRGEIAAMARQLCLAKDKRFRATGAVARPAAGAARMPRWQAAEVAVLRSCYGVIDNLELARRLGRSVAGVANKASQLGLRKGGDLLARIGRCNVGLRQDRAAGRGDAGGTAAATADTD
jgi:hypothetical protein